ncbi:hypothetical protein K070079E91_39120 [Eisenbergiella porci]
MTKPLMLAVDNNGSNKFWKGFIFNGAVCSSKAKIVLKQYRKFVRQK